jgi:hypothetical protein
MMGVRSRKTLLLALVTLAALASSSRCEDGGFSLCFAETVPSPELRSECLATLLNVFVPPLPPPFTAIGSPPPPLT